MLFGRLLFECLIPYQITHISLCLFRRSKLYILCFVHNSFLPCRYFRRLDKLIFIVVSIQSLLISRCLSSCHGNRHTDVLILAACFLDAGDAAFKLGALQGCGEVGRGVGDTLSEYCRGGDRTAYDAFGEAFGIFIGESGGFGVGYDAGLGGDDYSIVFPRTA